MTGDIFELPRTFLGERRGKYWRRGRSNLRRPCGYWILGFPTGHLKMLPHPQFQILSIPFQPLNASSSETGIPPQDGQWGGIANGTWNGLVAELINHETDMVLTSLKINSGVNSILEILLRCPYLLWKIWKKYSTFWYGLLMQLMMRWVDLEGKMGRSWG